MAKQVQRRRGSSANHGGFVGAAGEITVDTTNNRPVIHNGVLAGGFTGVMRNDMYDGAYLALTDANGQRLQTSATSISLLDAGGNNVFESSNVTIGPTPIIITASETMFRDQQNGATVVHLASGNALLGQGRRLSTSIDGFACIPQITGIPTTNATAVPGFCPIAINTGNMKLFVHNPTGRWWSVQLVSQ